MTTDAATFGPRSAGHVLRVIEFHVERFVEARWKTPERGIVALGIGVTDQAHRYSRSRELSAVTIRAGLMTGKAGRCRIVAAFVTRRAGDRAMTCAVVNKL